MTVYKFKFRCSECDEDSPMTYMVPDVATREVKAAILSCKKCEKPLLKIWIRAKWTWGADEIRYAVKDLANRRWILGGEGEQDDVSRDSFWGWVVDHRGERVAD